MICLKPDTAFQPYMTQPSFPILFLFVDGLGLGSSDPQRNPLAGAHMPTLSRLLDGRALLAENAPFHGQRASLLALDACLGVAGLPQSASGQAALLTGKNVPQEIGEHYGPKPNPPIAALLQEGGLFGEFTRAGKRAALLNAYPPGYFTALESGKRRPSAFPLAALRAGVRLPGVDDLRAGLALSADFTGQGWHEHLGESGLPLLTAHQAGERLAALAADCDLAALDYWLSDYAGHAQEMSAALRLLETFDEMLGGLLNVWDEQGGLIALTSDHGNLEDLDTRRHTLNPVPLLLIGPPEMRRPFESIHDLTGFAPTLLGLPAVPC